MADGHFHHFETFDAEQRGEKPVHALEKLELHGALPAEGPEAARGIAHLLAGDLVAHRICNLGGKLAGEVVAGRTSRHAGTGGAVAIF